MMKLPAVRFFPVFLLSAVSLKQSSGNILSDANAPAMLYADRSIVKQKHIIRRSLSPYLLQQRLSENVKFPQKHGKKTVGGVEKYPLRWYFTMD